MPIKTSGPSPQLGCADVHLDASLMSFLHESHIHICVSVSNEILQVVKHLRCSWRLSGSHRIEKGKNQAKQLHEKASFHRKWGGERTGRRMEPRFVCFLSGKGRINFEFLQLVWKMKQILWQKDQKCFYPEKKGWNPNYALQADAMCMRCREKGKKKRRISS